MSAHSLRGFDQWFELEGEGPPLIWSHGLYMSAEKDAAFFGFFPELRQRWRVLTFDARGHGRSGFTTDPADYEWDSLAADLRGLLTHVGIARAAFVGGSMGAVTTLTLAAHQPERVQAMVLFQPTCIGEDVARVGRLARTISKVVDRQGMSAAAELILGMGPWSELAARDPDRVQVLQQGFARQRVEAVKAASLGVNRPPGYQGERLERLRELRVPTLLIADPGDPSHPLSSAETLHRLLPQSELVVAPRNFYFFAQPRELLELIESFLRAHSAPPLSDRP